MKGGSGVPLQFVGHEDELLVFFVLSQRREALLQDVLVGLDLEPKGGKGRLLQVLPLLHRDAESADAPPQQGLSLVLVRIGPHPPAAEAAVAQLVQRR